MYICMYVCMYKCMKRIEEEDLQLLKTESTKKRITENVVETKIRFTSNESYNHLYLMGDFTNWIPIQLTKVKNSFIYSTLLLKNYKYYYVFSSKNEPFIVDTTQHHELNENNGQINNYITLGVDIVNFDYKSNYMKLEQARKDYTSISMDPYDLKILTKIDSVTKKVSEINQKLLKNKERDLRIVSSLYDEKEIKCSYMSQIEMISEYYKGRIFEYKGKLYANYAIIPSEGKVKCLPIYDKNFIPVDTLYYISKSIYVTFSIAVFLGDNNNDKAVFLPLSANKEIKEKLRNNSNKITVYYRYVDATGNQPIAQ